MYDERVTLRSGETPVLIVAPHGADDINTSELAMSIARNCNAFAVINNGWERDTQVDFLNSKANCNDIRHLHEEVVKEEMLDPIYKFIKKIEKEWGYAFMFTIHGVGNHVRKTEPLLDMIVGYGAGNAQPFHSCDLSTKDAFIYYLNKVDIIAYEGAAGGSYSGRAKNNLNQLFRRWTYNPNVQSMQLEIVYEYRSNPEIIELTGEAISNAIDGMIMFGDTVDLTFVPKKF